MELIYTIILTFSGLGVLLFGMSVLSRSLESAIGDKLNTKFIQLAHNPVRSCGFSALLTFVTQKTTLVSSMIMNYANLGSITLRQSLAFVIGLSIGNILSMGLMLFQGFNITIFFTFFCFVGAILNIFSRSDRMRAVAKILLGFGLLFLGIELVGIYAKEMLTIPAIFDFISSVNYPIIIMLFALLVSMFSTSTFLTLTILATLVLGGNGPVGIESAVLGILVVPIGTSIADYIYTVPGQGVNGRRIALYHILVNSLGLIILFPLHFTGIYTMLFEAVGNNAIITMIIVFMVGMALTALLLPFGEVMEMFLKRIIPDKNKKESIYAEFVVPESVIDNFSTGYTSTLNSIRSINELATQLEDNVMDRIKHKKDIRGVKGQLQGLEKAIKITTNTVLRISVKATRNDLRKTSVLTYVLNDYLYIAKKQKEFYDDGTEFLAKPRILSNAQIATLKEVEVMIKDLAQKVHEVTNDLIDGRSVIPEFLKEVFDLNKKITTACQKNRKHVYADYRKNGHYPESNMYFLLLQNLEDTNTAWNDIAIKLGILAF